MLLLWYTPPHRGVPLRNYVYTARRNLVQFQQREDEELLLLCWWKMLQESEHG